jgi:hypothetical protein
MTEDIFEFWKGVPGSATHHPEDEPVLRRVNNGFHAECLPGPFKGRLRTASVVLLFLSAGLDEEFDIDHARSVEGQAYYARSRTGEADLPSQTEHRGSYRWSRRILSQFGLDYDAFRDQIAFLNISPYKSKSFDDWNMLSALPSCRIAIGWAQRELFRAAQEGRRVVVCLRSGRQWGLEPAHRYGASLFCPLVGRNGVMHHGTMREEVTAAVQQALRLHG